MHKNKTDPSKPTYMTSSELSRALGYVPHMVTYFVSGSPIVSQNGKNGTNNGNS